MSAPPEATPAPAPAAPTRRLRPGRQAVIGLGAMALVLFLISAISIVSNERQGLRVALLSPRRVQPGEGVRWTVSVRDTAGAATAVRFDFGDGTAVEPVRDRPPPSCDPDHPATSESFDLDHVYPLPGVYTAKAMVTSGGCGAAVERAETIRTITVKVLRS